MKTNCTEHFSPNSDVMENTGKFCVHEAMEINTCRTRTVLDETCLHMRSDHVDLRFQKFHHSSSLFSLKKW